MLFTGKFVAVLMWIPLLLWAAFDQVVSHKKPPVIEQAYGVTFSIKQAEALGLDWRAAYQSILDDLRVRNLRLIAYWDQVEPEAGKFDFSTLDWQIAQAEKVGVKVILAVGMKLPRWPECHIPGWTKDVQFQEALFSYEKAVVERYKNSPAIKVWQVENEPFFQFGECPPISESLVQNEIDGIRKADSPLFSRLILVSDSGELGTWFKAARLADVVGTTIYRRNWKKGLGYFNYPLPAAFYTKKAELVKKFFGDKVIVVEMQAEPWVPSPPLTNYTADQQFVGLDFNRFRQHIVYAKSSRLPEIYFWGVEWWYWLKMHDHPEFWEYAKSHVFSVINK